MDNQPGFHFTEQKPIGLSAKVFHSVTNLSQDSSVEHRQKKHE